MRQNLMVILLAGLVLASCAQEELVLPTLAPSPTQEIVTEAPTPTPVRRATLPPTWTPVQAATPTAIEVAPTEEAPVPIPPVTPLEVCATFGEDRTLNKRTYTAGQPAQVFWTPVQGAVQYSISLVDQTGKQLYVNYTADTNFTFDASLLQAGKLYGWEVYPIDALGQQMCLGRGAELFPG